MVGDIEIGNDITERGCVKGKKEGAQDRTLRECERMWKGCQKARVTVNIKLQSLTYNSPFISACIFMQHTWAEAL